jgi:acetate kinase
VRVLVVNAGSSSLKLRLLGPDDTLLGSADLPAEGAGYDAAALRAALQELTATATGPSDPDDLPTRPDGRPGAGGRRSASTAGPPSGPNRGPSDPGRGPSGPDGGRSGVDGNQSGVDAIGHRVVHGGTRYRTGVLLDTAVEQELRALVDLAPLHQPTSLAAVEAVSAALPRVPAVACFDTAFHAAMPAAAATYPVPAEWRERHGLRRYGFHGLSHQYAAGRAAQLLGRPPAGLRVVTCHLGAGASLAAVHSGQSVDTTMGFTPLEGLMMATRSGSVDPGLVLWLQQRAGLSAADVGDALEHRSGLLGLAGTADMQAVVQRSAAGDPAAELALAVYLHRLRAGIAAMTAALSGLDALVFTGGVGENAAAVRAAAVTGLGYLGLAIDPSRNAAARTDADISAGGAAAATLVVAAREDLQIAGEVRRVLAG